MSDYDVSLRGSGASLPASSRVTAGGFDNGMLRFLRQNAIRWQLLLGAGEFLLLIVALFLAVYVRYYDAPALRAIYTQDMLLRGCVFAGALVLGMIALGLHQAHMRETWFGLLARQMVGFVVGALGLVIFYYAVPQAYVGRGIFGIALAIGFVHGALFPAGFLRTVDATLLKRRILVIGAGSRAALIQQRMRRRSDRRGFTIVGFAAQEGDAVAVSADHMIQTGENLSEWAERQHIDEIVVGSDDRRNSLPMEELLNCRQFGVRITDLTTFFERESGMIKLDLAEPSWLVFSQGFDLSPLRKASKRTFDLLIASVVLLLAAPFMLLTALAIRLESGKGQPILYRQERVGERGRVFNLIKFRSMRTDAEKDGVARWATKGDDRVTRVGRIIRRTRLDELPQLWNVFRGDMSVIGPRPERPQFVEQLVEKIRYCNLRHCVKPGLAGWAQLRYPYGASEADAREKLKYDLFYVKNHAMLFDLMILIQTVEVVLFGRGVR
jgi:sugar transferase (PEP-CTERM system associated)